MICAAEFMRNVDMQIYLINSTIRKTTIDLNLYKHVKNPLLLILLFMTFTFSVVVKLLFCFSVNKFLIQCLQERLKWIITNIFVIGKFHFQISVWIRKILLSHYRSLIRKCWKINFFISDMKNILLFCEKIFSETVCSEFTYDIRRLGCWFVFVWWLFY